MNKLILEEIQRMNLLSRYDNSKTLSEQTIPGGISQQAYNKIIAFSNQNKKGSMGSYLFKPQVQEIDSEFGVGTYSKFFNNGGDKILTTKTPEPEKEQSKSIPEISLPTGVSQQAVDKIMAISAQNKKGSRGSYLFKPQVQEIDSEFGVGTYSKFFKNGGEDVLKGVKIFKKQVNGTPSPANPAAAPAKPAAAPAKPVAIPPELKDIKAFQDWLDVNAKGWATGYKEGIINKGQNGGGYGKFGPRTQKAWAKYKDQFLKGGAKTEQPTTQTTEPDKKPLTTDTLPTNNQPLNLQLSPKQSELDTLKWGQK